MSWRLTEAPERTVRQARGGRRAALTLVFVFAAIASSPPLASQNSCVPVKGWTTLEDPVRLCAYLTDDEQAAACERRGFRLGEGVDENEAAVALQALLLCAEEYVIGVEHEGPATENPRRLAVTTAMVDEGDAASGYYDRGRVRVLVHQEGTWTEEAVAEWED